MRHTRALPTNQLMPAASSCKSPAATPAPGGPPGKNERSHPLLTRTSGNPSIIMSPDHRPRTQIRLCAGTDERRLFHEGSLTGSTHMT
jgi:hypothetical protein